MKRYPSLFSLLTIAVLSTFIGGCLDSRPQGEPFHLREKPLIADGTNPLSRLSEKDIGIPVIPKGTIVKDSPKKGWNSISFQIAVPLPPGTVVRFYENRLRTKAVVSRDPKAGEMYTLSFSSGGFKEVDGFKIAVKNPPKGSRKRTVISIWAREDDFYQSIVSVVHTTY